MIVTTTNSVEGYSIDGYLQIVAGETVVGMNAIKDFAAGFRDVLGGRSASYEQELVNARQQATGEMMQRAAALGAHAVVGVQVDYLTLGSSNTMVMVSVTGTAVTLREAAA
ncbi:YbjQ family protein [Corynebacterium choanae]|uniref:UPF0145 protein CCHOA_11465 n=1 Tax=Corynebacterium choanae TaxID=1862358 RepID=A0A3G6JEV0_9CORY|nr:heavy metal-binding domain-containing protein [Corynebacterium choanae]AZA14664.1 hypothetical protein CCHOA_11465 [Corynebacterium choanae]